MGRQADGAAGGLACWRLCVIIDVHNESQCVDAMQTHPHMHAHVHMHTRACIYTCACVHINWCLQTEIKCSGHNTKYPPGKLPTYTKKHTAEWRNGMHANMHTHVHAYTRASAHVQSCTHAPGTYNVNLAPKPTGRLSTSS